MSSSGIDKILILYDGNGRNQTIEQMIVNGLKHPHSIRVAKLSKENSKIIKAGDYGLLIINSNLLNPYSIDVVKFATNHPTATIIYIAEETSMQNEAEIKAKNELLELGVTFLMKPLTKSGFLVALNAADMAHIRLCTLKKKIDEEKIITRSKLILMEVLCMTEEQAHKYIERESMNNGVTRLETAYETLKTYDY